MDSSATLGIAGLPLSASALSPGSLYLITLSSPRLAQSLLFSCLPGGGNMPLLCVSRQGPDKLQDTRWMDLRLHGRGLHLLSPSSEGHHRGLAARVEELAHYRSQLLPREGPMLLVLDHAEELLPLEKPETIARGLRHAEEWVERHGDVLLLLLDSRKLGPAAMAVIAACRHAGLAHAEYTSQERYDWQAHHWLGAPPLLDPAIYPLELGASGALRLMPPEAAAENDQRRGDDQHLVYATRPSLGDMPPSAHWLLFDQLGGLVEAAQDAVAATVLLDSSDNVQDRLSNAVHHLRQRCGKRLKILVREVGSSRLRHNEEQLLLRLGANAVLPAELRFASLLNIIQSLQTSVYPGQNRAKSPVLREASQPEADRGYLPPRRFADVVGTTVRRSRAVDISNVLIQLRPAAGATPGELLRLGNFKRAGDLCTADRQFAYLFLFACRESDVDAALRHMFRLPLRDLSNYEVRNPDSDTILQALTRFVEQPGFDALPSLEWNSEPPPRRESAEAQPVRRLLTPQRSPLSRRSSPQEGNDHVQP